MKLWDKGYTTDNLVERYTVGKDRELDLKLARYDVQGSAAHAQMLHEIGVLDKQEIADVQEGLEAIARQIEAGDFVIEEHFEDVHSKVEFMLTEMIGEAGKKIHTARSRNDQVLVDLHLFVKEEINAIHRLAKTLFDRLIALADAHRATLLPGYTHLQVAMPSSFGLWFSAYAESLIDDVYFLQAAMKVADQNPLGSAAGYGSSFPINRRRTTELLGFSTLKYNVVAAQMSRGKLEKSLAFALASLAGTLGKFAMDVCLYMSQNFAFISFPKELTTGSSIMPHKQNPDVFEVMRARSNQIQQLPGEISMITANLPSGYHRDFQQLKERIMEAIDTTKDNLTVCEFMLRHIIVKENLVDSPIYDFMFSVEELNSRVLAGSSFRDAYRELGIEIMEGRFQPDRAVSHSHEGSIGNLCLEEIRAKFPQP
ncbi:MAG: argininosuccinate lyase [Bacteroidia bacterium]